jgi:hypothetical protein
LVRARDELGVVPLQFGYRQVTFGLAHRLVVHPNACRRDGPQEKGRGPVAKLTLHPSKNASYQEDSDYAVSGAGKPPHSSDSG